MPTTAKPKTIENNARPGSAMHAAIEYYNYDIPYFIDRWTIDAKDVGAKVADCRLAFDVEHEDEAPCDESTIRNLRARIGLQARRDKAKHE